VPVASRRPTVRSWRSPSTRTTSLTPTLPRTRMRGGSRRPRTSRSASTRPCTRPRNGRKGCACATSRFLTLPFPRTPRWSSSRLPTTFTVPPPGSVASREICAGPRAGQPAFLMTRPMALTPTRAAGLTVPSTSVRAPSSTRSSPMLTSVAGRTLPSADVASSAAPARVKRLRSVRAPAAPGGKAAGESDAAGPAGGPGQALGDDPRLRECVPDRRAVDRLDDGDVTLRLGARDGEIAALHREVVDRDRDLRRGREGPVLAVPVHHDVAHAGAGADTGALGRVVDDGDAGGENAVLRQHGRVAGQVETQEAEVHVGGGDARAQVDRRQPKVFHVHVERGARGDAPELEAASGVRGRQRVAVHVDALDDPRACRLERAILEVQRAVGDAEPVDCDAHPRARLGRPLPGGGG